MKRLFLIFGIALLLVSCSKPNQQTVKIPEPLEEMKNPEMSRRSAGSLWSNDTPSLFSDHKAQNVGDIVTVLISEQSSASKEASTKTGRTTNMTASIPSLFGLEKSDVIEDSNIDLTNLVTADFRQLL